MYDIIHFEALGLEAEHLADETRKAQTAGLLPASHSPLITPLTLQQFLTENPNITLPDIITIKTHSTIPAEWLAQAGMAKGIITRSAGYDHLEHLTAQAHITSLREYCVQAVAQTAMKFLYAAAGMLNRYELCADTFERNSVPSFMELGKHRRAALFGVGKIGKAVHDLLVANGLDVVGVDIRAKELAAHYGSSVRFVTRDEALATADIVINAMNLTRNRESRFYNVGYFSCETLAMTGKPLIFINVTRGEIAPEHILLELLQSGTIIGLGLDVFSDESELAQALRGKTLDDRFAASKKLVELSLARCANVYVQPHQGFNSDCAVQNKALETIRHLISWYKNSGKKFDDELPYY